MSKADSRTRLCGEVGCGRPMRARDLCVTHYNQQHQPERHRKVTVECGWCGKPREKAVTARFAERFCSYDCRDTMRAYRSGLLVSEVMRWHRAHPQYRPPLPMLYVVPISKPTPSRPPRISWVAGKCRNCDAYFVDTWLADHSSLTCSPKCGKRISKDRERARKRAAFVAPVSRAKIYARDCWRCQLCHKPVAKDKVVPHPHAPVLDHIIPLAAGVEAGGVHAPHNVQCAHFMCNSIKRDRIDTTQLALFV